jgi:hypothetical protein
MRVDLEIWNGLNALGAFQGASGNPKRGICDLDPYLLGPSRRVRQC